MTIGKGRSDPTQYKFVGPNINQDIINVDKEKDIGVTIDSKLSFNQHRDEQINKANRMMGLIRRMYIYLDCHSFKLLYKALVRPHLEYAATVWRPFLMKDIDEIKNVQRRATRQIPDLKGLSYEERLRKIDLPTLVYRRQRGDMIEVYKMLNDKYDKNIAPILKLHVNEDTVTRGHNKKLFLMRSNKLIRKNSFSIRVVIPWNSLPDSVVNAPSLKAFERRLDKHWRNQPVKFDYKAAFETCAIPKNDTASDSDDLDIEA